MKKYFFAFILASLFSVPVANAAGLLGPGNSGGVLTPGLWIPNTASSTITPNPGTLQVPCANIVGGCVSGGASTSTTNTFGAPQNFNGIANTGNVTSTSVTALNTSTPSVIENFDNVLEVPAPYSSSTYGDFGTYITNWYNQQVLAGRHAVAVHVNPDGIPTGMWKNEIVASSTGTTIVISCPSLALITWSGNNTSTYLDTGTAGNETFGSGWNGCYVDAGGNGSPRSNQTFVQFGGANGAYTPTFTNNTIYRFHQGLVSGSNAPFVNVSNNNFQYTDQPIFFNFSVGGTSNVGENSLIQHNIFGGCEASNVLGSGASSSVYIVNGAGVHGDANSLDDCTLFWGNGTTGDWSGWIENPGVNVTPYSGKAVIQVATSTTNSLTIPAIGILNDTSSTTSTVDGTPSIWPWIIENDGYLVIKGGTASANGTASSVAELVHTNGTAYTRVENFLNTKGSTNYGLSSLINSGYPFTSSTPGSPMDSVTVNNLGYPYGEATPGSNHVYSYGGVNFMQTYTGLNGASNAQTGVTIGNNGITNGSPLSQPSSSLDIDGTLGLLTDLFSASETIAPQVNATVSGVIHIFTGSTSSTVTLPLASLTQHRVEIFVNDSGTSNVTLTIQATSTDHIYQTSSVTSIVLPTSTPLRVVNGNGSTWYSF